MSKLTNSQKHNFKKRLQLKLEALGIKDETVSKQIGKKPVAIDKDGQFIYAPVFQLQNIQQQMINKMLKHSSDTIEKFLNLDNSLLVQQTKPPTEES
jgi:hypothetical protein